MEFDLQPTLRGALLELRPLAADDFAALYEAANDPLIWEQHPEPTRWQKEIFSKVLRRRHRIGWSFRDYRTRIGQNYRQLTILPSKPIGT